MAKVLPASIKQHRIKTPTERKMLDSGLLCREPKTVNLDLMPPRGTGYDVTRLLHDLQVYRLELENQTRQLLDTRRELEEFRSANVRLKHQVGELEVTNKNLTLSNTDLQQFAYVASHNLQEPIRVIATYIHLIQKRYYGKLDGDASDFINFAASGVNQMQRLIHDLLTYAGISTRGKTFSPVDMQRVMSSVIENLQLLIRDTNAIIIYDALPVVYGDDLQIGQVLGNLIDNAIKYRSQDPPFVRISADFTSNEWLFSVRDNGIGIAGKDFNKLFQIFQRLSSTKDCEGTGIGLAICKRIVERHGGKIWVDSKAGDGATFYFTLPDVTTRPEA